MTVVVQRSTLRMWLLAMGGIPLLVIAVDVLTNRRITNWLRELIFNPNDTQIFEPRDVIWAWAMCLFAAFLVGWGLKELFLPTKVLVATDQGVAVRLRGPRGGPDLIPWGDILDAEGSRLGGEEGDPVVPVLLFHLSRRGDLPELPWAARWVGPTTLAVLAEEWAVPPPRVAEDLAAYAVEAARREARARTARVWDPSP